MVRVVYDTNILISSIFWARGNTHKLVELAIERSVTNFTSSDMLNELTKVLRVNFEQSEEIVKRQVALLVEYSTVVNLTEKLSVVKDDTDDDKVIECAVAADAQFIVSGDHHLLKLKSFRGIKIVAPAEFLNILAQ